MRQLFKRVDFLKNTEIKSLVDARLKSFKEFNEKSNEELFIELCFCILTANFNAERSIKIQEEMADEFLTITEIELAKRLKQFGHRYPNARAEYIVKARQYIKTIKNVLEKFNDEKRLREWLVKNVKGLGYKEASHFLRNIGYENLAIIDFHIIDVLVKHGIIEKPKTLTRRKYLKIEEILRRIAARLELTVAELDLYLWYIETGKILK